MSAWLLALDTSTTTIVVAAGTHDGSLLDAETFEGRYRHSQELLPAVVRLVGRAGLRLPELAGIVVGMGPGAFTGLRVGLATAKTLAHELDRPVVGIASGEALLAGVPEATRLWLPSGPRDRVLVVRGAPPVVVRAAAESGGAVAPGATPGPAMGASTDAATDTPLGFGPEAAVDLDGRAPEQDLELGRSAVAGLAASLLRLGAARLAAGESDDPERLVPLYASAPRGAIAGSGSEDVAWSRDLR